MAQRVLVRAVQGGELRADFALDDVATAIALSPDGSALATGGEAVEIQPLDGGTPRQLVESGDELVAALAFSQDGSLLTVVRRDGTIARLDVETGERLVDVEAGFPDPVIGLGPDGAIVRLIDANTGPVLEADLNAADPEPKHVSDGANSAVVTAVGPDGVRATAFADGLVGVGGGEVEPFRFRLASLPTSLAFSSDGRSLTVAGNDGTVAVWDVQQRSEVARLQARDLGNEPVAAAYRPEGEPVVAVGAVDGSLTLWKVGVQAALAEACRVAARNLTQEEWDRHVGSFPAAHEDVPGLPLDP